MTGKWDEIGTPSTASGTVTSVGLALPVSVFIVSGSPVTTSGTLTGTFITQTANTVFAGPTGGAAATPAFRALVAADLPAGTGTVTSIAGGVGITNTPEPITTTGTVDLDINSLTTETLLAAGDLFPFQDVSVSTAPAGQRKVALSDLKIALFDDFRFYGWSQYGSSGTTATAVIDVGLPAQSVAGTPTAFQDATGAYLDLASVATTNSNASTTGPTNHTARNNLPRCTWTFKTGTVITVARWWVVLNDTGAPAPFNADDPAGANLMGFRYSTAAGDTTWRCVTKDGTTLGNTDSGVTVVADTRYEMAIDATVAGTVTFYINGALVATRTTNLPTNGASLQMFCGVRTLENVSKNVRFRKYQIRSL